MTFLSASAAAVDGAAGGGADSLASVASSRGPQLFFLLSGELFS